ncbi:TonB-dependent receptor [Granulicella arctica]|uniref:TonB-dependent receptor n=1 Tax=Granulicella arctica TaxID=940613 RepID=UPI0021DF7312|nr:TonB-dependent receptor [Granulicella arctica]
MMHRISHHATNRQASMLRWSAAVALLLTLLIPSAAAHAQVLYGSITGTVADASNAVVPNAPVTVTNQTTNESRTATTNSNGEYVIRDLQAGPYTLTINPTASFSKFTEKNVAISINQQSRVDVTLQLGSVSSEVTVNSAAPILQTETAEVNHEISQTEIAELPITSSQGRNFQNLYALIPGVAAPTEQNSTASNPARAISVNVNGVADTSNTTRIDGAVNTYGWLPYIIAYVPPADSIGNVNIVTNSFNAEQGTAGGSSINVQIKSGTNKLHGSVWEYNQIFNTNARAYTATQASVPRVPKNVFNQYGFSVGGPIKKDKLFFFGDFERTTRRSLISGFQTVPTPALIAGNFSATNTTLYDPATGNANGTGRLTFLQEYGINGIPASRMSPQAAKMLALLQPIAATITNPDYTTTKLNNDFFGTATAAYNREAIDAKISYNASANTTFFGRYSISPDSLTDPQELGAAGGGTFDGGQPGSASGRIQNVGLGATHIFTPNLVLDSNFGYTRQRTGAQADDIALGSYGLTTLGIPGTNGPTTLQGGIPVFAFSNGFSSLGNSNGSSPFLFRDNQYTGNVNVSYTKGKHATKYGAEYYHFALNHFQPTSGSGINNPRGGFMFTGNLTALNGGANPNIYNSLADFELGDPNSVAKATGLIATNALRWSAFSFYAQDQWTITKKLTLNYGARYEYYPAPTRDHEGIFRFDPTLPLASNVIAGGFNGVPNNAGTDVGMGLVVPRLGIAYRVNEHLVVRSGAGITEDPDNFRFLRDTYPVDLAQNYAGVNAFGVAVDTSQNNLPLTLAVGIPAVAAPNFSSGSTSLPVSVTTTTIPQKFRRGYIESWNLFIEQDLGNQFVFELGYVGTHEIRQITSLDINPAPLPSSATLCDQNGIYSSTETTTKTPCSFNVNRVLNTLHCPQVANNTQAACYNNTDVGAATPAFSSNYNGLQTQLTRRAGRLAQFGLIYTWSHAFNFSDNSSYNGASFSLPQYFSRNRASAGYDHPNNLQFWSIYHLPFGGGQMLLHDGIASKVFGGLQLNTTMSHVSGAPFSVTATNNLNAAGTSVFADLVKPYRQLGGHAQGSSSPVSGGQAFFDPTSFAQPAAGSFGNTHRNEFRGPGTTLVNASVFRSFHVFRESSFQVRVEGFNLLNHAQLTTNPNASVTSAVNGYITTFGNTRSLQYSGRFNF